MKDANKAVNIRIALKVGIFAVLMNIIKKTYTAGDHVSSIIPNFLLFTPFTETTKFFWKKIEPLDRLTDPVEHVPVSELSGKDFTYEALKKCTNNFRSPCVVRDLFKGTPAVKNWTKKGYLSEKIGNFTIPYVKNRVLADKHKRGEWPRDTFGNIFHSILDDKDSKKYMFFPAKGGPEEKDADLLDEKLTEVVRTDLELDKLIWNGFGSKSVHSTFRGTQFIAGRGTKSTETTTGTGWHCAPGNNWFIQITGTKVWYFMDPIHSSFMHPVRGGQNYFQISSNTNISDYDDKLPIHEVEIRKGDMLYNPDFQWHTILNGEGLSIGVPLREFNITTTFQNNALYTSIVIWNNIWAKLGISIGGFDG